jgi:uncharacterized membrane protein required for colicin V production
MGLDIALGIVILIAAFRGWLQGFITQAVRIGGLIACVYLAAPVRDLAKPRVVQYLPTVQPEFVDRILWWVAAVVTYIVLVGVITLLIKMTRRPEIPGMPLATRNDQFAGFFVGAVKGLVIATLLAAAIQKYGLNEIKTVTWADEQAKASWALRLNEQYQPVPKIWSSRPVRDFVNHIQRMGIQGPSDGSQKSDESAQDEPAPVRTARRSRDADAPGAHPADPRPGSASPAAPPAEAHPLGAELEKEVEEIKSELGLGGKGSN